MTYPRIAFAGDRDIGVWVLDFILSQEVRPLALLVPDTAGASHTSELVQRCSFLDPRCVLRGTRFRQADGVELLSDLDLDYIVGIHFPYLITEEILRIPRVGVLNLHPAYLPFNRGWHTPTWALLDQTPAGATLHFMDAGIDTGDIVHQRALDPSPGDTANTLYHKLKALEFQVFKEAWPQLLAGQLSRTPQQRAAGTAHRRADLFQGHIQRVDLDELVRASTLIRRLRALTTNRMQEAAYYEVEGTRYRIQVVISEDRQQGQGGTQ